MNDEELREAARTLDSYNEQLETISRQIRILQSSRDDNARAIRTIDALAKAKEGDEIMIPIGASSFVTVKVTAKKSAVVGIGNRVSVEKDYDDTKEYLMQSGSEIQGALERALGALQEVQQYTEQLAAAVQNEYRQRRLQQTPQQ